MDIKTPEKKKKQLQQPMVLAMLAIVVIASSLWSFNQPSASEKVSSSQVWTDIVKQGDIELSVEGYGKLKSKEQRLLTTPANATVEEILLKPGSLVTVDSIIVRLSNPAISQQVKDARRELKNAKTGYLQLGLNQQREILAQQAQQEQLMSELEIAELKVTAEESLVEKGIVSKLTFKRSQLNFRQLSRRIKIEKKRLAQLTSLHQKELDIAQDTIEQQDEMLLVINEKFEKLTVRAGINGVVQSLAVELGQSVVMGEQVALVGSIDQLYAMLNVSQSDMEFIELNQIVKIDTRSGVTTGMVSRINPVVEQGMVAIEINITGDLPNNARPELNVDGVISTGTLTNVMYIKKPVNASSGSKTTLFKMNEEANHAEQVDIVYGRESGEFIQIASGAHFQDSFILSDMSRWKESSVITITQ
jgi:HlyD family secretion protein